MSEGVGIESPGKRFVEIDNPRGENIPIKDRGEGKVKEVTNLRLVLTDLKVNPQLIDSTVSYTESIIPLLGLIGGSKDNPREGRGVYLDGPNGEKVYSKGNGSEWLLERDLEEGELPGYPRTTDELMYDTLKNNRDTSHPRIVGTETLSWGMLEFVNAAVVFAEIAKREGWTDIQQAVKAGVTIPIGLLSLPELTAKMRKLLESKKAESEEWRRFLDWEGNEIGLASVGLVVPTDQRKFRGSPYESQKPKEDFTNSQIAETTGRTLRRLLDMGIVYSKASAHGQNLYTKGLVAQSDNSDFVLLGEYEKEEERGCLIVGQLAPNDNMVPLWLPVPSLNIPFEEIAESQKLFWQEFIGDIDNFDQKAINELPKLMPLLRTQINFAVAKLLSEKVSSTSHWKEIRDARRGILRTQDPVGALGTERELDKKIKSNLDPKELAQYKRLVSAQDPLGVQSMLRFLQTGDKSVLMGDDNLRPYFQITEAICTIPETHRQDRDKILEQMGNLQFNRGRADLAQRNDIITIFNGRHIEFISSLITSGDYYSAALVAESLDTLQTLVLNNRKTISMRDPEELASELLELLGKYSEYQLQSELYGFYQQNLQKR